MMNSKDIIDNFFGKRFGRNTRQLFYSWFLMNDDSVSKDSALKQIWDETEASMDNGTIEDLNEIKERITNRPTTAFPRRSYWKYAAIVSLLLTLGLSLYTFLMPSEREESQMAVVTVPYGKIMKLALPDSTRVSLNGGSVLVYPNRFGQEKRDVFLSGEARFEVSKDSSRPFSVNSNGLKVKALGTVFTTRVYPNDKQIYAFLEEGGIEVSTEKGGVYKLMPDEKITFDNATGKVYIDEVDAKRSGMWHDGFLVFDDEPLADILSKLEIKYKVDIFYVASKYNGHSYTVRFLPEETLEEVLDILSRLAGIQYNIDNDKVYIR